MKILINVIGFVFLLVSTAQGMQLMGGKPPAATGTDMCSDTNVKAFWRMDTGGVIIDSCGTNTLTNINTVGTDTVNFQEGDASASFTSSSSQYLTITQVNLDSGFPYKNGETNKDISVAFWMRPSDITSIMAFFSIGWDNGGSARSLFIGMSANDFWLLKGVYTLGGAEVLVPNTGNEFQANQWYHIGVTYKDSDKTWKARIYDLTGTSTTDYSGTAPTQNNVSTYPVAIGASFASTVPTNFMNGRIDGLVVFDDILTLGEIDQIRAGTYP